MSMRRRRRTQSGGDSVRVRQILSTILRHPRRGRPDDVGEIVGANRLVEIGPEIPRILRRRLEKQRTHEGENDAFAGREKRGGIGHHGAFGYGGRMNEKEKKERFCGKMNWEKFCLKGEMLTI